MKIDFTFLDIPHPNGDISVYDLALILEKEYKIIEIFCNDKIQIFYEKMINNINRNQKFNVSENEAELRSMWYAYGREGLFGNKGESLFEILKASNKASKGRAKHLGIDRPFVDTGTYLRSMRPYFVFTNKELDILRDFIVF